MQILSLSLAVRKPLAIAVVAAATIASVWLTAPAAEARAGDDKVTICHRTHSVTNPYRMITVSKSSINGPLAGGTGNADGDHAGRRHNGVLVTGPNDAHVANYPSENGQPVKVFKPGFAYSGPNKIWQDIIPPFVFNGQAYSGLNWTPEGRAIYFGTGDKAGLCKKMSAGAYVASERAARAADPNIPGMDDRDIRNDLIEQGVIGEIISNNTDLDSLPNNPPAPAGPKAPANKIEQLMGALDTSNTVNNVRKTTGLTQAIAGVVWFDANRNGVQEDSERLADGVGIVLIDPETNQEYVPVTTLRSSKPESHIHLASVRTPQPTKINLITLDKVGKITFRTVTTTITVYTDADGYFQYPSVPAGDWIVKVVTPDGFSYTYDSTGSSDGIMPDTNVPEGGIGFAWAGLATETADDGSNLDNGAAGAGTGSGNSSSALANTGSVGSTSALLIGGASLVIVLGVAGAVFVRRRRSS